ncbi:MAG: ABC transporter ATP-binding protein/permease [Rhodothermaceae bacterium]|nr:ABC transporter ATP-binding protein/permease [Rhodothermaceae bacterium]
MPLIDPLSEQLKDELRLSTMDKSVHAVVYADLDREGRFAEEWLVVRSSRLTVYGRSGENYTPREEYEFNNIKRVTADSLVGGGSLLVAVNGHNVEVLRYSNGLQRKFARVAEHINELKEYWEKTEKAENGELDDAGLAIVAPDKLPELVPDEEDNRHCLNCNLPLPEGTNVCPACMSKGKAIRRVLAYLNPHKKLIGVIWVMMMIGIVLSLIPTYLTEPLTDKVLNPVDPSATVDERITLLGWLVLLFFTVQLSGNVLGIVRGRLIVKLGVQVSHALRNEVFSHLQNLSLRYFDKRHAGSLISRVTRDTTALERVLIQSVEGFFSNILLFIGIGSVLLWMNWKLTLLVFIPAPFVLIISRFFWTRLKHVWRRFSYFYSRVTATVSDSLAGIRVVRAFAKEDAEVRRFDLKSQELLDADIKAMQFGQTFFPIMFFIMGLGNLIVWYVGGYQVIEDSVLGQQLMPERDVFTLGQFFVFLGFLSQFYQPLHFISRMSDYLSQALAAAERVFEVLDTELDVKDAEDPVYMPKIKGRVAFKDVTFGYDVHKPVLKNIEFDVKPGEMIGLVGRSGSGKSTTINLLCRFYEVTRGAIEIDGVNIKDIAQKDLRSQIGVVLQEPFLFSGSIYENIAYAKPDATKRDIMAAAKAANAHGFIVQKPDGYDTLVGERGQTLSGGERQRISIARAILHNPRILILDEATASVDTDTEKQIQEAIARLVKGRTTFAIAHRLSTLRNASRLIVLKNGEVAEVGTHEELMEAEGEFYRFVQMQSEMSVL